MFDFRDYGNGIFVFDSGYLRPLLAAVHMVVENGRVAFVDTGTNQSLPNALGVLERLGLGVEAVDYVILTHIHLDHAGGAGAMMQAFPNARLVVHPRGARHMGEPSKLVAGVIGVYGAEYVARMYGEILPIPFERIIEATHGLVVNLAGRELVCLDTPGHARHHNCIVDRKTGGIFTGDMFGLCYDAMNVDGRQFIFPTTTPTQFEPDAMRASLDLLMSYRPPAMYLTHYGQAVNVPKLRDDLQRHVDAHVAIGLAEKEAGADRHTRIKARLTQYLLKELRTFGCTWPEDKLLEFWENDLELNAQGVGIWLDTLKDR